MTVRGVVGAAMGAPYVVGAAIGAPYVVGAATASQAMLAAGATLSMAICGAIDCTMHAPLLK